MSGRKKTLTVALALAIALVAAAVQYSRPLPAVAPKILLSSGVLVGGSPPPIPWPSLGAAGLAVSGLGLLGTSGPSTPLPMASTAKIMTALLVLEDHPLGLNEQGPAVTITAADVSSYYREQRLDESGVRVVAGEQLTEYQLLEGLLLPSAGNFADTLAAWDAGSITAFVAKMNARASALAMLHTHYDDASGFSPQSVSMPSDLLVLAEQAMGNPVFAQVVGRPEATLPVVGVVRNLDTLLGQEGIVGVKTGHTNQAGGCFVFAADVRVGGAPVRLYGAVMGQANGLPGAFTTTKALIDATVRGLHNLTIVHAHDAVGYYQTAWGARAGVMPAHDVSEVVYDGMLLRREVQLRTVDAPVPAGSVVGLLRLEIGHKRFELPLQTVDPLPEPSLLWRLTRTPV